MSEVYNRIEGLCAKKHVSITAMCREAGISRSAMTELKTGRTKALLSETASKIAAYFGVSVDYILGSEQKEKTLVSDDDELNELLEELKNRPELRMLFSLAKGATKDDVLRSVKIIEALLGK